MSNRINGAASSQQSLSGSLQYYMVYASSPGAFTDPNPNPDELESVARILNIQVTENIKDESQKNFEILLQTIALRSMPVIMSNPEAVISLENAGAPTLTGEGFVWKFSTERENMWFDYITNNPVGLLIKELDGSFIDSGVRITTVDGSSTGIPKNIEFVRMSTF